MRPFGQDDPRRDRSFDPSPSHGARSVARPAPEVPEAHQQALRLMTLIVFVDLASLAIALPVLPFWAQRFGADPLTVGLFLSVYGIAQLLFAPVVGALSDAIGRRPVIVGALVIETVGLAATAMASSIPVLLGARFVSGLGASSIGSAQAVVADVTRGADRTRWIGRVGAAVGLGFVVGPALGATVGALGTAAPFWAAAVITATATLVAVARLPETRQRALVTRPRRRSTASGGTVAQLIAVVLLYSIAFGGMETVLPLYTQQAYGWGSAGNGALFTFVGLVMVAVQGGAVRQLRRRLADRAILFAGLVVLVVGLSAVPLGASVVTLAFAVGLVGAGVALIAPSSSTLLASASGPEQRGERFGAGRSVGSLGRVIGPAIAGWAFSHIGPGAPFLVGAGLGAGGAIVLTTWSAPHEREPALPDRR